MKGSRLQNFLDAAGRIRQYPAKRGIQLEAVGYLAEKIELHRFYTEAEVNDTLNQWHCFQDPALLRRELIVQGYLDRSPDGCRYWRIEREQPEDGR